MTTPIQPTATAPQPPPTPADSATRFHFVQLQVSYFMAQMSIGDTKAGGMLAFVVALSGVTAQRMSADTFQLTAVGAIVVSIALGMSLVTFAIAAFVLWPRRISVPPPGDAVNNFSWVQLAMLHEKSPGAYRTQLAAASVDKLTADVANVMEDIAAIVRRKYVAARYGFIALVPAAALHIVFWLMI
jgi:hypothetical protein